MDRRQQNHLSMFMAVRVTCDSLEEILGGLPSFNPIYEEFKNVIELILVQSVAQEYTTTGKTTEKRWKKEYLVEKTMEIIRRVMAYATVNKLLELKAEVNYSKWKLKRQPSTVLCSICSVVNERASSVLEGLEAFGVTQEMLDEQEAANEAYFEEIPSPRNGIILRKNATSSLKKEFKRGNDILRNDLDRVVAVIKTTNADAYNRYTIARIIVDLRGKRKKCLVISGKVVELENGMPASGVLVSIVGTTIVVMTGMDGSFRIPIKKEGKYILRCTKEGRKVWVAEVEINGKHLEEVMVKMERAESA